MSFHGDSAIKCLPIMQEPLGLERSLGEGNDNPLWYSCLENPMDREDWWATVHRVTKSRTPLNTCACKTKTKQKANKQNMKGDNLVSAQ